MAALATACGQPVAPSRTTSTASRASSRDPSSGPSQPMAASPTVTATVTAVPAAPDPRIGAVFVGGQSLHACTASVLHSTTGDLILTAAHCMAAGLDASFVPGFTETAGAQDFWHIDAVYLDPRWVATQDPLADFAIARVSRPDGESIESAAGGGLSIGSNPPLGTDVAVMGYALGVGGVPVGCTARVASIERGYPSIRCGGLVDGTSGSPWLVGKTVVGVTGGLDGGGCNDAVSYSSPFGDAVPLLLQRAEAGGAADVAPSELEDDC